MSLFGKDKKPSPPQPIPQPAPRAVSPAASAPSPIETVIGPNTRVKGNIQGDGGLKVEGIVEGALETTGNLVITESAKILAEVKANNISVAGAIKGNVTANRIEILDTGRVWGDLTTKSCLINEGAYLRGQIIMPQDLQPPQLEPPKSAPPEIPAPQAGTVVDIEPEERPAKK